MDRGRSTALDTMGGWYRPMPRLGVLLLLLVLTGIGLPGLANFVGEFLVLSGSVETDPMWGGIATAGIVVSVAYFLRMYERSMLGPLKEEIALPDLGTRETLALGTLVALILWLGLYPTSFLDPIEATTGAIADIRSVSLGVAANHALQ
jgi:NADH-quinone oxidoreductase subunit M